MKETQWKEGRKEGRKERRREEVILIGVPQEGRGERGTRQLSWLRHCATRRKVVG